MKIAMSFSIAVDLVDEEATANLAHRLARLARPGDVIALEGPLGSGKTAFARAFIQSLVGADEEVPSPTFTLTQIYDCSIGTIWHFDLYRLEKPEDALELGIEDAFAGDISLIEWPDRLGTWLPRERLTITLAAGDRPTARRARLTGSDTWTERLREMLE